MMTAEPLVYAPLELKERAEAVLEPLGFTLAEAEIMFLREIVERKRLPFEAKRPRRMPLLHDGLTQEQFDAEIQKAMDEVAAGKVLPLEGVEAELAYRYGI